MCTKRKYYSNRTCKYYTIICVLCERVRRKTNIHIAYNNNMLLIIFYVDCVQRVIVITNILCYLVVL